MYNLPKELNTSVNSSIDDFDNKITKCLRALTVMVAVLAFSRLLSFEILTMIGEIMTAIMIYLYSLSQNKCMAIFCMINGVIGMLHSFFSIFHTFPLMKTNWFSFYYSLLFTISLYSILVYLLICYFSYFGLIQNSQNDTGLLPTATSYGAITVDNKNTKSFIPFEGKGTIVG
jgi:hypothetical protein